MLVNVGKRFSPKPRDDKLTNTLGKVAILPEKLEKSYV